MIEFAKQTENGLEIVACHSFETERIEEIKAQGFLQFIPRPRPEVESGKKAVDTFRISGDKIIQSWEFVVDIAEIEAQIEAKKNDLAATDYKVLKCYEANLAGLEMPYDINQLHAERQLMRDQINALEAIIESSC